jgi:tetratricopeptide (TPR) repeat protein
MPLIRGVGLDEIIARLRAEADGPKRRAAAERSDAEAQSSLGGGDFDRLVRELIEAKFAAEPRQPREPPPPPRGRQAAADRWGAAARLGLQAAEALHYAHEQGTLHRDVKPGNILVDEDGNACLADFGLARAIEPAHCQCNEECEAGDHGEGRGGCEVVGTPRYMAPEQLRGKADRRSDLYGLGLALYELITLRTAGHRRPASQSEEPSARASQRLVRPRRVDRTIPRDLEAIVLKCLAAEPAHRYRSAAALAADLRRFLDDRPVRARRASRLERVGRWCRRNPALAAASTAAAVFVAAFVATAVLGYMHTRAAYRETRQALARAEATSGVALEVLEGLYLQLSPERVWIPSDSDPAGQACACVGLRSARPASTREQGYIQVQPCEQTAALLENLLVFYDRLAEKAGDDARVMLESAVASRRVGDIRQRLGQIDRAENEYLKAIEKLGRLREGPAAKVDVCTELARCFNEIGNVRSARFEPQAAHEAHLAALESLQAEGASRPTSEESRYELARTYFFLASRHPSGSTTDPAASCAEHAGRPAAPAPRFAPSEKQYRKRAIDLLEGLARENPEAADYRFLLALCYRPLGVVPSVASSADVDAATGGAAPSGRRRALEILESLKREYPQVADYRCELAATYAWVHVGLFPWQGQSTALPKTHRALRKALDEARWLVANNPTIPHHARSKALVLAKLGSVCQQAGRTSEAVGWFERALADQEALVERFADLPPHDRVLAEFFRYRLASLRLQTAGSYDAEAVAQGRAALATCTANLAELSTRAELADDRLAESALRLAEQALARLPSR